MLVAIYLNKYRDIRDAQFIETSVRGIEYVKSYGNSFQQWVENFTKQLAVSFILDSCVDDIYQMEGLLKLIEIWDLCHQFEIALQKQNPLGVNMGYDPFQNNSQRLVKQLKTINIVNQRLAYLSDQIVKFEKLKPDDVTPSMKMSLENMERDLIELKKQQIEIVEQSIKFMFDMSSMVHKEKNQWLNLASNSKLSKYQQALAIKQGKTVQNDNQ
ncbi:UNKNOWN [Stylonychia lemnae]|uniref:Uncharacterized protein n=1 Tax=Stylonychia lemnae TaxID=5949 RepID=A0A078ASQ2_STYLE|nr:UNKNOWN [Stylonychia lemnae]|eukprot:CDW85036.1 UNKNOWN [Stylonychia lemnae]